MTAHAQKPDFVFRRNGRVQLNRQGRQFSLLLAAEVCASAVVMLDTPCSEVAWRVLATRSIRLFPLHFPSCASPCAITFQLESTRVLCDRRSTELRFLWSLQPCRFSCYLIPRAYLRVSHCSVDRSVQWQQWPGSCFNTCSSIDFNIAQIRLCYLIRYCVSYLSTFRRGNKRDFQFVAPWWKYEAISPAEHTVPNLHNLRNIIICGINQKVISNLNLWELKLHSV